MDNLPNILLDFYEKAVSQHPQPMVGTTFKQAGEIRLSPDRSWMKFTATQSMSAHKVDFCWHAKFKMASFIPGSVVDAYQNGMGRLDAKIFGLIPVAHARGPNVDQGEIQRYLAELPWCPGAIITNKALNYKQISDHIVRV